MADAYSNGSIEGRGWRSSFGGVSATPLVSFVALIWIALGATGCATLDEDQCRQANWEHVGHIDGQRGRPESYVSEHVKACEGMAKVDETSYMAGWQRGHAESCEPENGYFAGLRGERAPMNCPTESEKAFEEQYRKGRQVHLLERQRSELRRQIEEEKKKSEEDESVLNHVAQAYHLLSGTSPTRELESREYALAQESRALQASAPMTSLAAASYESSADPLQPLGAAMGTVMGFGIGHAFQGRYKSSGWMWTVGEVATIAAIAEISVNSCPDRGERCTSPWPTVGVLGFLAFRIWQAVDLWSYAARKSQGYDLAKKDDPPWSLALAPNGIAWSYSFE